MAISTALIPLILTNLCSNYPFNFTESGDIGCTLKEPKLLLGRKINIATLKSPPLSTVTENGTGVGTVFDFISLLQMRFGFEYTVTAPENNILGDKESGIMGLIASQKAEMGAAFLPWFPEYAQYIQYSVGLMESDWVVLLKRPPSSASGSGLLAPFNETVWYYILASVICTGPVFYVLLLIRYLLIRDAEGKASAFSVGNCVWFVFGALMKQGSTLSPISDSSRVLFATWWIFITILTSFYTANLTAFLTLSKFTLPIKNAEDIAKYRYKWIAQKGGALEHLIALDPTFEYLNKSMKNGYGEFMPLTDVEMLVHIEKNNRMYLREKNAVDHLVTDDYYKKTKDRNLEEKDRCTFVMTPDAFMAQTIAFAYSMKSDLGQFFDPMLQTMVETGIVKYLMRRDLPGVQVCPLDLGSKERQLINADLWMTYLVVIVGFSTSIGVFIAEMLIRLWRHCHAQQLQQLSNTSYPGDWKTAAKKSHLLPYPSVVSGGKHGNIDGADFMVGNSKEGDNKLISSHGPNAFLFQYSA